VLYNGDVVEDSRLNETWMAFMSAHALVTSALDRDIEIACGLSLTWLEVLYRLRGAPDHRYRMHQLASACHTSKSGLTRLVDRMEAAGLIRREAIPGDRRSLLVVMTEAGGEALARAIPRLEAALREHFGRHIHESELDPFLNVLRRMSGGSACA
jgi:DNA-binding MarR family transcriptional regulator